MTAHPGPGRRRARGRAVLAARRRRHGARRDPRRGRARAASTRCTASAARRRSPRWRTAPRRSRPVDVIVGPGQRVRRRGQAPGLRRRSASTGSRARRRSRSSPTTPSTPRAVAADLLAQAEHGPGGAAALITWDEAVADAVERALDALLVDAPTRRDEAEATLDAGGRVVLVDGPGAGDRRRERDRARAPRAHVRRRRRCSCRSCATRARCSSAPYAPAVLGDYVAGVEPRAADRRHRAVRRARCGSPTSASTCTSCALDARRAGAGRRRRARRSPRPRASTRTPTRSACARSRRVVTRGPRPQPRDDLRALEGYHSPQVDVDGAAQHQREPVRAAGRVRRRVARRAARRRLNRYPDRGATRAARPRSARSSASRPSACSARNGSNEVLQTLLLTYGGAGPARR